MFNVQQQFIDGDWRLRWPELRGETEGRQDSFNPSCTDFHEITQHICTSPDRGQFRTKALADIVSGGRFRAFCAFMGSFASMPTWYTRYAPARRKQTVGHPAIGFWPTQPRISTCHMIVRPPGKQHPTVMDPTRSQIILRSTIHRTRRQAVIAVTASLLPSDQDLVHALVAVLDAQVPFRPMSAHLKTYLAHALPFVSILIYGSHSKWLV